MNPCDKKSDYNCYNHYIDLGFDDERGCLEEYKCDEPTVTECPDSISEYREFKLESCGRKGWSQNNSDCWLDSALYALFGTTDLSEKTSRTLNKIHAEIPALGLALRNYLIGLEKDGWDTGVLGARSSRGELCKQHWKNHIATLVIRYAEEFLDLPAASSLFQNVSGHFRNGDISLLFLLFAHVDSDHCTYFSTDQFRMVCSRPHDADSYMEDEGGERKALQRKFIKHVVRRLSNETIGAEYFFVDIRGLDMTCRDMTRVVECYGLTEQSGRKYNLVGICHGKGIHYTASVLCNGKWYGYDNQLSHVIDSTTVDFPFSDSEHLVLLFNRYADQVKTERRKTGTGPATRQSQGRRSKSSPRR